MDLREGYMFDQYGYSIKFFYRPRVCVCISCVYFLLWWLYNYIKFEKLCY